MHACYPSCCTCALQALVAVAADRDDRAQTGFALYARSPAKRARLGCWHVIRALLSGGHVEAPNAAALGAACNALENEYTRLCRLVAAKCGQQSRQVKKYKDVSSFSTVREPLRRALRAFSAVMWQSQPRAVGGAGQTTAGAAGVGNAAGAAGVQFYCDVTNDAWTAGAPTLELCLPALCDDGKRTTDQCLYKGAGMTAEPHKNGRYFSTHGGSARRSARRLASPVRPAEARSAGDPYAPHGEGVKDVPTHGRPIVKGRKVRPTAKFRKGQEELDTMLCPMVQQKRAPRSDARTRKSPLWEGGHNDVCDACSTGGTLVCCSFCNLAFHQKCTSPPLLRIPPEEWACTECALDNSAAAEARAGKRQRQGAEPLCGACPKCNWTAPLVNGFIEALRRHDGEDHGPRSPAAAEPDPSVDQPLPTPLLATPLRGTSIFSNLSCATLPRRGLRGRGTQRITD